MKDQAIGIDLGEQDWGRECLRALRDLTFSIELLLHAVTMRNLEGITRQTANQERLCHAVHEATVGLARSGNREMRMEIEAMTRQVREQNRLQAAVLRRARRTTDIFSLVLAYSGVTYRDTSARANHG